MDELPTHLRAHALTSERLGWEIQDEAAALQHRAQSTQWQGAARELAVSTLDAFGRDLGSCARATGELAASLRHLALQVEQRQSVLRQLGDNTALAVGLATHPSLPGLPARLAAKALT